MVSNLNHIRMVCLSETFSIRIEGSMKTETEWKDLHSLQDVAKAQSDGWEIQRLNTVKPDLWAQWSGSTWCSSDCFRGRHRQPEMKEVKMICWMINGMLYWYVEESTEYDHWIRQPHLDMIAKVPK